MKSSEIIKKPEVGKCYKLRRDPMLGDWSGLVVLVEKGPRGAGDDQQYRASYGSGAYEVDWIDTIMFDGSKEVREPPGLRYKGISKNSDK